MRSLLLLCLFVSASHAADGGDVTSEFTNHRAVNTLKFFDERLMLLNGSVIETVWANIVHREMIGRLVELLDAVLIERERELRKTDPPGEALDLRVLTELRQLLRLNGLRLLFGKDRA